MCEKELLPNLFRTEYQKIVSVLIYLFGIQHLEVAEDIVSDTFLSAAELWAIKGVPEKPEAWLYTVAKNKTRNYLKRNLLFEQKLIIELKRNHKDFDEIEIDLSVKNISDSQLSTIFMVCNPLISGDAQVSLALNLLCGFGIGEIADAYLTNKEVIYKRINRAKKKLKEHNISVKQPTVREIEGRLENVLKTLYLLFSEGYYSNSKDKTIRMDMCAEAMRLTHLLTEHKLTDKPPVFALLALMCFHSSRFEARTTESGENILYEDQDESRWNQELISAGKFYLNRSSQDKTLSKYHLEAAIAYWHTQKADTPEKWRNILEIYDSLLLMEYSPMAALNRTYAVYKVKGSHAAIVTAEELNMVNSHFYHALLGTLYQSENKLKAIFHFEAALTLANSDAERNMMESRLEKLKAA